MLFAHKTYVRSYCVRLRLHSRFTVKRVRFKWRRGDRGTHVSNKFIWKINQHVNDVDATAGAVITVMRSSRHAIEHKYLIGCNFEKPEQ